MTWLQTILVRYRLRRLIARYGLLPPVGCKELLWIGPMVIQGLYRSIYKTDLNPHCLPGLLAGKLPAKVEKDDPELELVVWGINPDHRIPVEAPSHESVEALKKFKVIT